MNYFPLTENDREEMKKVLNIKDVKELFSDLPAEHSYFSLDEVPEALTEDKLIKYFKKKASENSFNEFTSFLGSGAYNHFIPEVVNNLSSRSEFLTPYTPYQAEVSQGSLQTMFEYQTMIAQLTGMDVANSSLYDGGTAAVEAALLALRKSKRKKILISKAVHPEYIEIIKTYLSNLDIRAELVDYNKETGKTDIEALKKMNDKESAGILFQSPNFFGIIEDSEEISEIAHADKSFSVQVVAEAMSMALLKPAGELGVDIIAGEAQSFGMPLSFGGPFLGFMAIKKAFTRQMPGRVVGQTVDHDGKRGYVLTLSTREQHIKRSKATSNICSNQAHCAVRAAIYLATMGKQGLRRVSMDSHLAASYFVREASGLDTINIRYKDSFYNEVVVEFKNSDSESALRKLEESKLIAGTPMNWFFEDEKNSVIIAFTEVHDKKDIDALILAIGGLK